MELRGAACQADRGKPIVPPLIHSRHRELFAAEWVKQHMIEVTGLLGELTGAPVRKRAITNHRALNEAYDYPRPSSFSRGTRVDFNGVVMLLISGTASIDERGQSVHIGDFRAQTRRTYQNVTALLESEGATWKDVVRTTCYLRDIERDYAAFNEERTAFYTAQGLDPLPASTGIQAILCRPELLVEVEAMAIFHPGREAERED